MFSQLNVHTQFPSNNAQMQTTFPLKIAFSHLSVINSQVQKSNNKLLTYKLTVFAR